MRFPEQHLSVAVLCNRGDSRPPRLALDVAELYLGDLLKPDASNGGRALGALPNLGEPQAMPLGAYRSPESGEYLWLMRDGDKLKLQSGTDKAELRPPGSDVYVAAGFSPLGAGAGVAFIPAHDGHAPHLVTYAAGYPGTFVLTPDWAPGDLSRFVGTYWSPEARIRYKIVAHDGGLALVDGATMVPLRPAGVGEFEAPGVLATLAPGFTATLRFSTNGAVDGFVYSTPDNRGLKFQRRVVVGS
ncbi:hypothetical protein [Paraburkholderia sp.]|uniref:hypothetical protein n=1 Tax=Paraburkholderia sp. TaxID=1926495 RepID=UPI002D766363|nr:hypothetical protein [Paraburkholderia sp.]